jgi:hypothetical protein
MHQAAATAEPRGFTPIKNWSDCRNADAFEADAHQMREVNAQVLSTLQAWIKETELSGRQELLDESAQPLAFADTETQPALSRLRLLGASGQEMESHQQARQGSPHLVGKTRDIVHLGKVNGATERITDPYRLRFVRNFRMQRRRLGPLTQNFHSPPLRSILSEPSLVNHAPG